MCVGRRDRLHLILPTVTAILVSLLFCKKKRIIYVILTANWSFLSRLAEGFRFTIILFTHLHSNKKTSSWIKTTPYRSAKVYCIIKDGRWRGKEAEGWGMRNQGWGDERRNHGRGCTDGCSIDSMLAEGWRLMERGELRLWVEEHSAVIAPWVPGMRQNREKK